MRILWICPFFPYPPDTGSRIREYNLIKALAQWHEVSVFSLIQSPAEARYAEHLQELCAAVWTVLPESRTGGRRRAVDALLGIVDKRPNRFYGNPPSNVVALLNTVLAQGSFDVLLVETLFMSNYLWGTLPCKDLTTVLVELNVETLIQKQQVPTAKSLLKKFRKWLYYQSFAGFERRACRLYDYVAVVSELDRRCLLELVPELEPEQVTVVPNGIDIEWYSLPGPNPEPNSLIYNGALTYEANLDAMTYFLNEIFPLIRRERPSVKLRITGKTNGVDLSGLPLDDHVVLTGYLDDVRPLVKQSWGCIVPLRWGGGTRLKALEALALGTPVISTSKGVEGLDLVPGRDLLIADEPADFAAAVIRILQDVGLRKTLGQNGRQIVAANYDWQTIGRRFNQFIEGVVSQARPALERE